MKDVRFFPREHGLNTAQARLRTHVRLRRNLPGGLIRAYDVMFTDDRWYVGPVVRYATAGLWHDLLTLFVQQASYYPGARIHAES